MTIVARASAEAAMKEKDPERAHVSGKSTVSTKGS
jgi:hypothetical protein